MRAVAVGDDHRPLRYRDGRVAEWPGAAQELPTLATELRKAGYTANYIGKWHMAPGTEAEGGGSGASSPSIAADFSICGKRRMRSSIPAIRMKERSGCDGNPITFKDEYRVDFITDRAEKFLRQKQETPFLLMISQLEPHQQNDLGAWWDEGSAERFSDAFVLRTCAAFPATGTSNCPTTTARAKASMHP